MYNFNGLSCPEKTMYFFAFIFYDNERRRFVKIAQHPKGLIFTDSEPEVTFAIRKCPKISYTLIRVGRVGIDFIS
jgi:hypothetical protein